MTTPEMRRQLAMTDRVTAGNALDEAWRWLCDSRKTAPDNAGIWHLRHHWYHTRDALLTRLLDGQYCLTPMLLTKKRPHQDRQVMWDAQDALVLKWTALLITPHLDLHPRCEHVKVHGGGPSSVQRMAEAITTHGYTRVFRTDVKGYYRHINKDRLMAQVRQHVADPVLQDLIQQYIHYTVEEGGEFHTPESGIARGCALSPLMGALHLAEMDRWFGEEMVRTKKNGRPGIYYARYMDDIVILAHTRWQLRRQVRALNGFFNEAGFSQHPDKTFTGRTERGFDWMGAQMSDAGVEGIAHRARVNHFTRIRRLYEQLRRLPAARRAARVSAYRRKWTIWAVGLTGVLGVPPAIAAYGDNDSIAKGVKACLASGSISDGGGGVAAGSRCSITLPGNAWANNVSLGPTYSPTQTDPPGGLRFYVHALGSASSVAITLPAGVGGGCGGSSVLLSAQQVINIAGGGWQNGTNLPQASPAQRCLFNFGTGIPPYPSDGTYAGSGNYMVTPGTAIMNITFKSVASGNAIEMPNIALVLSGSYNGSVTYASAGLGGGANVNPNPPDPIIAGDPPNCTAITGVSNTTYDFGNAAPGQSIGAVVIEKPQKHSIALACTAGAKGSVAATATLYMKTANPLNSDKTVLMDKTTDWLGLAFKFPSTMLNGITKTANQTGNDVIFDGANKTPVINWALPAYTKQGTVGVPALVLTPYIKQLQATPGTQDGARKYTVTYSVAIQ